jgi:hypothetical protein
MSRDHELQALRRAALGGDAGALARLERALERMQPPAPPEPPACCEGREIEFQVYGANAHNGRWELERCTEKNPNGCCSFLPPDRNGVSYGSLEEAQAAADLLNARLAARTKGVET